MNKFYELLEQGNIPHRKVDIVDVPEVEEVFTYTERNYSIDFVRFITVFPNKESFLFAEYYDLFRLGETDDKLIERLQILAKRIKSHEEGRVGEYGFEARPIQLHQSEIPNDVKHKMLWRWVAKMIASLADDNTLGFDKRVGDILVVCPKGQKDYLLWTAASAAEGTRQRQILAKRGGFNGPFEDDDSMYGEFIRTEDKKFKLIPIKY